MGPIRIVETGTVSGTGVIATADVRHVTTSACVLQVTGAMSATLVIRGTVDGTFTNMAFINCATGAIETTITAAGQYRTELVGQKQVQAYCSAYTSGSPVCTLVVLAN